MNPKDFLNTRSFRQAAGYRVTSVLINRIANVVLSLILLIPAVPVSIVVALFVLKNNGRPVLYKGDRFGKRKRVFTMYKFRTLPPDFEASHAGSLVNYHQDHQLPWFSRFLRDTRLDEIPQLINVLKGDMDLIGPRPVRPAVYEKVCRKIKDYDKRFLVNPGLVGYSQLFTPHSTPKRIRSFIDNKAARNQTNFFFNMLMVLLAIYAVIRTCVRMMFRFFVNRVISQKVFKQYMEKRGLDRIRQKEGAVYLMEQDKVDRTGIPDTMEYFGVLFDINEEFFRVDSDLSMGTVENRYVLKTRVKTRPPRIMTKSAFCYGEIYRCYENSGKGHRYSYIIKYAPVSNLNQYFVDQYFLQKSLMRYVF